MAKWFIDGPPVTLAIYDVNLDLIKSTTDSEKKNRPKVLKCRNVEELSNSEVIGRGRRS